MTDLEKALVNRPAKGASNVVAIRKCLRTLGRAAIGSALEIGCGTGEVAAFLAQECGYQVVGVDVDSAQVALARSRHEGGPNLRFVVADAGALVDFEAGRFDLVVAQNVFHHLAGWRSAVSEMGRVVRPGGFVLWLDLALPSPVRALLSPLSAWFGIYSVSDVRTAFRGEEFSEMALRKSGFWLPIRYEAVWQKAANASEERAPAVESEV